MELTRENIKLLVDNHLIGTITTDEPETYRVTTENIVDFIEKNFVFKRAGIDRVHAIRNND